MKFLIGNFKILYKLGSGRFGEVFLGIHNKLKRNVAIKKVMKDQLTSPKSLLQLQREISILKQLNHPYINYLYDVIEDEESFNIIMELSNKGSLKTVISGKIVSKIRNNIVLQETRHSKVQESLSTLNFSKFQNNQSLTNKPFIKNKLTSKYGMNFPIKSPLNYNARYNSNIYSPIKLYNSTEMNNYRSHNLFFNRGSMSPEPKPSTFSLEQPPQSPLFDVHDTEDDFNEELLISEEKWRAIFKQIVTAIKYLHKTLHVIHRDLKAENILFGDDGNIRLVDFGLSRQIINDSNNNDDGDDNILNMTACGTPTYMAPEVLLKNEYSFSADIWSIGILLYLTITGEFPFAESSIPLLISKICNEELAFPDDVDISDELKDLIQCLLRKNPAERIDIDSILQHPWFTFICPNNETKNHDLDENFHEIFACSSSMFEKINGKLGESGYNADNIKPSILNQKTDECFTNIWSLDSDLNDLIISYRIELRYGLAEHFINESSKVSLNNLLDDDTSNIDPPNYSFLEKEQNIQKSKMTIDNSNGNQHQSFDDANEIKDQHPRGISQALSTLTLSPFPLSPTFQPVSKSKLTGTRCLYKRASPMPHKLPPLSKGE